MLIYQTTGWIHLSLGTTGRFLRWTVLELSVTGLLFLLALRWGPVGIAAAWTASFCILTIPAFWYAGKPIDLKVGFVLNAIWRYIVAALIAGLSCAAIVARMRWHPLVETLRLSGDGNENRDQFLILHSALSRDHHHLCSGGSSPYVNLLG